MFGREISPPSVRLVSPIRSLYSPRINKEIAAAKERRILYEEQTTKLINWGFMENSAALFDMVDMMKDGLLDDADDKRIN
jgi:hypothetical protein